MLLSCTNGPKELNADKAPGLGALMWDDGQALNACCNSEHPACFSSSGGLTLRPYPNAAPDLLYVEPTLWDLDHGLRGKLRGFCQDIDRQLSRRC